MLAEKRLKLLSFVGAKKIFGKFASGNINHIGIKKLQLILYKVCLMLGVEVVAPCALVEMSGNTMLKICLWRQLGYRPGFFGHSDKNSR